MLVRLTTDRAGFGWEQHEGDLVELPRREALRLIRAGQAVETAAKVPPEARNREEREHAS